MDERSRDGFRLDGAIAETRHAFIAALHDRDAHAASAVYAEEARLLPPSSALLRGRDAIQAFWKAGLDAGISAVRLDALEVEQDERFAYEIGRYELHLEPAEGGPVVDRGNYVLVHERQQDGSWLWAVETFTPDVQIA